MTRAVAALVAALLVVGVVAVVVVDPGGDDEEPATEARPITAVVDDLEAFVARTRGLEWKREVDVAFLDDDAFRTRLKAETEEDVEEAEQTEAILRAVGLLDRDVDLREEAEALVGDAVVGFYDSEKDELAVRGTEATPYVRRVLVHELTHALDDQWFDLDRPEIEDGDSEAQAGFQGLVEGSASRVEQRYDETLDADEREAADREEAERGGEIDPDVPEVLLAYLAFPYLVGPRFADTVYEAGGQARLDAAFASPPKSTEQLLHPERYLEGDDPVAVAAPTAPRDPFDEELVGELSLLLMLQTRLEPERAQRAADGWEGDRYVAWNEGDRTCLRASVLMNGAEDGRELAGALREWGASVEGENPVTFTSCA